MGRRIRLPDYGKLVLRFRRTIHSVVMTGLVPAIPNCSTRLAVSVDGRHKAGHDD